MTIDIKKIGLNPIEKYELTYKRLAELKVNAICKMNMQVITGNRELSTKMQNIRGLFYEIDKRLDNINKEIDTLEQELEK